MINKFTNAPKNDEVISKINEIIDDKVDKISTALRIYGTDSSGVQSSYQAGDNISFTDNKISVTGVQQQLFVMPEATADLLGSIVQYLGDTNTQYTHGVMYQCVPVYGSFTVTTVGISNVTLDEEAFKNTDLYDDSISNYIFECTSAGLRQTWLLPDGRSWSGTLLPFGISYIGRPTIGATITLSRSIVGYTWEPYAGVSAGNDKIRVVGEKIYGINVVGQYNQTTMPTATAELAGKIVQYNGTSTLLSIYTDGHFYRCEEDRDIRRYTLEAEPMKYSDLSINNLMTLESYMRGYDDPVTFVWQGDGRGWIEEESMSMLGTNDLTQYGIAYTLESGQTLETGDKITINFTKSYSWYPINVQDGGLEVVQLLPEASADNVGRVVLFNGWDSSLPEPDALYVPGKLYTCVETYSESTGEFTYEWQALPFQFSLLQYTELPSDPTQVYTDQCVQYVGASQFWDKYAENVYLENGHIYRATIVDEDDPDFAAVRYIDIHPYQMVHMPDPIAAYEGVVIQYVGDSGDYTNGYFYKCVATGEMTEPSDKVKKDGTDWSVSVDPNVLETQTTDPDQTQVFEFRSQGEGSQWLRKVDEYTWSTVELADYGITVTGTVPYGSTLKVKYVEPQDEYAWERVNVQDEQIQADWSQSNNTAKDYIKNKPSLATVATTGDYDDLTNKPTIPTVNNATLTIQKNSTTIDTFTANASSDKTINITVPTAVTDLSDASNYALKTDLNKVYKASGTVASANDLPTLSASVLGNVYNVTTSFTSTSDFVEGSGKTIPVGNDIVVVNIGTDANPTYKFDILGDFVDLSAYATTASLSTVATSGSYSDLSNKPTIPTVPTTLSSFTDDLGTSPTHTHSQYLTSHQDITGKEDTSNKVTSLSSNSTDTQYPSAKCVYDLIGNIETLLSQV